MAYGYAKRMLVLVPIALAVGVFSASAQEQSRRALAEELINVMDAKSMFDKNITMVKQMWMAQTSQIPGLPNPSSNAAQAQDKTFDLFSQYLNWDRIKDDVISIYAETYTEDEMKGIIAFYRSPSGQALLKRQPELLQRTLEMTQKWMREILPKIQEQAKQPPK